MRARRESCGSHGHFLHSVIVGRRVVYHSIGEMRLVVMITITIPGIGDRLKLERETQNSVDRAFQKAVSKCLDCVECLVDDGLRVGGRSSSRIHARMVFCWPLNSRIRLAGRTYPWATKASRGEDQKEHALHIAQARKLPLRKIYQKNSRKIYAQKNPANQRNLRSEKFRQPGLGWRVAHSPEIHARMAFCWPLEFF